MHCCIQYSDHIDYKDPFLWDTEGRYNERRLYFREYSEKHVTYTVPAA